MSSLPLLMSLVVSASLAEEDPITAQVQRLIAAFNAHDVPAMVALTTDDIAWFGVAGSTLGVEARGHVALAAGMTSYFEGLPSARSELMSATTSGPFLTAVEKASWVQDGEQRSQCSVSVYELSQGLIKHVWYYPAHPCDHR